MGACGWIMGAQVLLGMLVVQLISTGSQILSKVILNQGIFIFSLITYRHTIAALCIAPFALYFERGAVKKLTFTAFFWLFMVALTGISIAIGLFYYGIKDTSATYATNFLNLIPVFTFFFATIFRIEKLRLGTNAGKIKFIGAMLCLGGAITIALYKGQSFHLGHFDTHDDSIQINAKVNKTRGTVSLLASCLSYALWFILQVKLFKVFPYKYWSTLLTCIIGTAQAAVIGLCIDREPSSWRLGWNLQLVTIVYSGMLATAATFSLITWSITKRGPTYPSMFNPLGLILTTILEALILGEEISVGSLIGMCLIIMGLYSFLWGKHKDIKAATASLRRGDHGGSGEDIEKGAASPEVVEPITHSSG